MNKTTPLCPSARPEWADSEVFGVVNGTVEEPRVTYLNERQPITDELIALCDPVTPTEVFRIAAPCVNKGCQHFDGTNCRLVERVVQQLPTVAEELPPCPIRRNCRWWQQEGKAACMRCPQVVTDNYNPSEKIRQVATPTVD
ncbi:nitrogen fixation protein [[Phormidium ambiguum] IAM M-71]|uniref:Nitrogen fixation protein n=1 Tax=[Phormidium ambiguum] IAM M-71 TaxID=454136 RepID=A0A1U7ITT8_9CYAN|nr:nitrogen fixation protein [Phormidium ambiguum]OKH40859.1 nitrogen fixation protein [Phormidium ambiguum IAM M-71]